MDYDETFLPEDHAIDEGWTEHRIHCLQSIVCDLLRKNHELRLKLCTAGIRLNADDLHPTPQKVR